METEFKEKTYEKYFSHEVSRLTNISYSPDACDENLLGFDEAFLLPLPWMVSRTPFVRRGRWARMHGMDIRQLDQISDDFSRRLPPFRFNLFVQYKRPTFLQTRGAGEWENWGTPYYRYITTPHQQDLLEKIEQQSLGRAATIYASPAFWKSNDLWDNVKAQTIIENSNIASVGRLKGHGRYTYNSAGFQGKGHSEATDIESPAFESLIGRSQEGEPLRFNTHIKRAAKLIVETTRSIDDASPLYNQAYSALGIEEFDDRSFASALAVIEAFSDAFGVSYIAIG
jgi:hypothetical protein